jgi:hypothetical protein
MVGIAVDDIQGVRDLANREGRIDGDRSRQPEPLGDEHALEARGRQRAVDRAARGDDEAAAVAHVALDCERLLRCEWHRRAADDNGVARRGDRRAGVEQLDGHAVAAQTLRHRGPVVARGVRLESELAVTARRADHDRACRRQRGERAGERLLDREALHGRRTVRAAVDRGERE